MRSLWSFLFNPYVAALSPRERGKATPLESLFDEDYIEMDPVYEEPPDNKPEEDEDNNTDTLKADRSESNLNCSREEYCRVERQLNQIFPPGLII